jgi:hypothetical protein
MSQSQLVVALLSLLVLGLGAIAATVYFYARHESAGNDAGDRQNPEIDGIDLAHRRRDFMKRYPAWAGRDFQNDRNSPWYTDPEFAGRSEVGSR